MVTVILVQEIIQYSLITCEFESIVLASLGIIVANSHACLMPRKPREGVVFLCCCVYIEICFFPPFWWSWQW